MRDGLALSVLCLRVLQASIGYLNTLMIQDVLADGAVALTAEALQLLAGDDPDDEDNLEPL